uniref:uncharacterized protein mindy4b isoform X4 n=1 Tax=Maylandia zebra TaxID=106582 RepID=UPI00032A1F00|nr:inactive ubiquitin carboxyl-terminal hydrolase MINDY-4B isoform X4 [Maylandia zebra]
MSDRRLDYIELLWQEVSRNPHRLLDVEKEEEQEEAPPPRRTLQALCSIPRRLAISAGLGGTPVTPQLIESLRRILLGGNFRVFDYEWRKAVFHFREPNSEFAYALKADGSDRGRTAGAGQSIGGCPERQPLVGRPGGERDCHLGNRRLLHHISPGQQTGHLHREAAALHVQREGRHHQLHPRPHPVLSGGGQSWRHPFPLQPHLLPYHREAEAGPRLSYVIPAAPQPGQLCLSAGGQHAEDSQVPGVGLQHQQQLLGPVQRHTLAAVRLEGGASVPAVLLLWAELADSDGQADSRYSLPPLGGVVQRWRRSRETVSLTGDDHQDQVGRSCDRLERHLPLLLNITTNTGLRSSQHSRLFLPL